MTHPPQLATLLITQRKNIRKEIQPVQENYIHSASNLLTIAPQQDSAVTSIAPIIAVEHLVKRYKKAEVNAVDDSRHSLWEYLNQVRRESGTTVFLTTHYLEEAEEADAICIINKGKNVASGTPEQVKAELTASSLLLNAEDRSRLRAELQHLGLPFSEHEHFELPLVGRDVQSFLKTIETPLNMVRKSRRFADPTSFSEATPAKHASRKKGRSVVNWRFTV
jgi:hypothetical protein